MNKHQALGKLMNIAKSLKKNPKQTKQKQKHDKKTKPPNLSGFTYFQLFSDQFSWNIFFSEQKRNYVFSELKDD